MACLHGLFHSLMDIAERPGRERVPCGASWGGIVMNREECELALCPENEFFVITD